MSFVNLFKEKKTNIFLKSEECVMVWLCKGEIEFHGRNY